MAKKQKQDLPIIPIAIIVLIAITAFYAKTHKNIFSFQNTVIAKEDNSTVEANNNDSSNETPDPSETPEPKESEKPEPSETPEANENEFNISDDKLEIESGSVSATSKFPLSFDKTTNTLTVTTGNGTREIRILPDQAASIATTSGIVTQIQKIELKEGSNNQPVFDIQGTKVRKLFGIFTINIPLSSEIDATTGHVLTVSNPSFIFKLLAPFIK